jgi:hypothetical protein
MVLNEWLETNTQNGQVTKECTTLAGKQKEILQAE